MTYPDRWPDGRIPVLISAHTDDLVQQAAQEIRRYLQNRGATVPDVAAQLTTTRRVRRHRALLRAADPTELDTVLRAVADGAEHRLLARHSDTSASRVAFVFPGQGNQWPSMGAEAYHDLPAYRAEADLCAAAFVAHGAASPLRYLTCADALDSFTETEVEGAQFTHAVALARVWQSYGVLPDLTVGHSLGEIGAAYVAGAITVSDAAAVVAARAAVVDRLVGDHAVAVLGIDERVARQVIEATPGWLELSVVNSPSSVAVAGDRDAIAAAVQSVRASGRFAREITVGFPVHTSVLEPLHDDLLQLLPDTEFADTAVQFIGGTTGAVVPAGTRFGPYWYANLRHLVRFDHAVQTATACGARTFVELSANPSLLFAMSELLGDTPAVLVGSGRRDEPVTEELSANLAAAALADPHHPWRDAHRRAAPLRGFPNAPMRATAMWAAPEPLPSVGGVTVARETWTPTTLPERVRSARIAVVDMMPGAESHRQQPLTRQITDAVAAHPGARRSAVRDAEIIVVVAPALCRLDPRSAAEALTDMVGKGLLRYAQGVGSRCRDVWLVTTGAERVGGDPSVWAAPAALAAAHRSVAFEHPDRAFHHLDLPAGSEESPPHLVDTVLTGSGELALRRNILYRRTIGDAPITRGWRLDSGLLDNVVITGGAGAVGLHHARFFAEHGARRIILLGRRGADPDTLAALAHHGTEVYSPSCDITDRGQLAATAAVYAGDGASLLIHAAGAAVFATADRLDTAAVAETFAAKVTGFANVTELWPVRTDARMLLCSSVSGVWGGLRHTAYAAANRVLDVMAADLRGHGRHCVSVRWGLWDAPGGIVGQAETARIERAGLHPMPPDIAIEASLHDHHVGGVDPLVLTGDMHRLQMFFGAAESTPSAIVPAPHADTVDVVRTALAAVLSVADEREIALEATLFDLGVDSLLALDLRKRFTRVVGATVPLATLLGGITGAELVVELDEAVKTARDAQRVDVSRD